MFGQCGQTGFLLTRRLSGIRKDHAVVSNRKSNSNGTYFGTSLENINRNEYGFVDFEKMVGLDGIALVDIVSNPEQAVSGKKALQSRITHNDGMC